MVVADGLLATIVEFKRFYAFAKGDEQSGRRDSGKGDGDGGGGLVADDPLDPEGDVYIYSNCNLKFNNQNSLYLRRHPCSFQDRLVRTSRSG